MSVSWEPLVVMTAAEGTCGRERCKRAAKWQVENCKLDQLDEPSPDLALACTIHLAAICTELAAVDG